MLVDPPRNGQYLVAAYIVTTVILGGYWLRLLRLFRNDVRGKSLKREREKQKG